MSEHLLKDEFHVDIDTVRGADWAVQRLFWRIERQHGEMLAQRLFAKRGRAATKAEMKEKQKWEVLEQLDRLPPGKIRSFAKERAETNKSLPRHEQRGLGGIDPTSLEALLRTTLRERAAAQKAGTWYGPPWPEPAPKRAPTIQEIKTSLAILSRHSR